MSGSMTPEHARSWLQALVESIDEVASVFLGMEVADPVYQDGPPSEAVSTASIRLSSPESTYLIGIAAERGGCTEIARALLGMVDSDGPLDDAAVDDAFAEVLNMVAGGMKKRLSQIEGGLMLGLPAVKNDASLDDGLAGGAYATTAIGTITAQLAVSREGVRK